MKKVAAFMPTSLKTTTGAGGATTVEAEVDDGLEEELAVVEGKPPELAVVEGKAEELAVVEGKPPELAVVEGKAELAVVEGKPPDVVVEATELAADAPPPADKPPGIPCSLLLAGGVTAFAGTYLNA